MIIEKTVIQANQPNSNNVLWGKPTKDGVLLYVFTNGKWLPVQGAVTNGTVSTDDDSVVPLDKIMETSKDLADIADKVNDLADNSVTYTVVQTE